MNIARALTATAATAALVAGATVLATGTASAASYKCTTSKKSVDHPGNTVNDNFNFSVKTCAKREGGYIYTKAYVSVDGPWGFAGSSSVNDARALIQVKRSVSGTDPVSKYAYGNGLGSKLNNLDAYGNTSYTSPTVKHKAAAGSRYLGDSVMQIDWRNDGKGRISYNFSASPTV
ncbi:hypothetical protein AB0K86_26055 [Streptomyces clavifer]|uniref:hypothetical protein n=1 Tax=Streptomyces TaxID=1883 RepID=UPI0006F4F5D5|nr:MULTISPECIES: hypothetical protein [unclassified Streptomyces]KQZ19785.1 hypothetical protein ASD51_26090 [Streptomyces sp. Root55]MDX3063545.1 hypothetical protein [Streptomyces sp. ND04-05B]